MTGWALATLYAAGWPAAHGTNTATPSGHATTAPLGRSARVAHTHTCAPPPGPAPPPLPLACAHTPGLHTPHTPACGATARPQIPENPEDLNDEQMQALQEELSMDFDIGFAFKENLIPRAVEWWVLHLGRHVAGGVPDAVCMALLWALPRAGATSASGACQWSALHGMLLCCRLLCDLTTGPGPPVHHLHADQCRTCCNPVRRRFTGEIAPIGDDFDGDEEFEEEYEEEELPKSSKGKR
jgi:hypothetical protein